MATQLSTEDRSAIAKTIWQQLGGNRFANMVGARNLLYGVGNAPDEVADLTFKIMRNPPNITHVRIALKRDDTYRMYFLHWNGRKVEFSIKATVDCVYVSNLRRVFSDKTKLDTSL